VIAIAMITIGTITVITIITVEAAGEPFTDLDLSAHYFISLSTQ
jgi:hypothetical protein